MSTWAEDFKQDGFVIARGLLGAEELDPVRRVVERVVEAKSKELFNAGAIHDPCPGAPWDRRWNDVRRQLPQRDQDAIGWNNDIFGREVYELATHPRLLNFVEQLIGPEIILNGDYWLRPKLPGEVSTTLPWHQDSTYIARGTAETMILTVWLPLVDVDEINGCLQVIPGSHLWGLQPFHTPAGNLLAVPVKDPGLRGEPQSLKMRLGDALGFTNLTYHRSLMNRSDRIRWSIDLRYSRVGDPLLQKLLDEYPGFVAHSRLHPENVETFESWSHRRRTQGVYKSQ